MANDLSFNSQHPTYKMRQTVPAGRVGAGERTRDAFFRAAFPTRVWNAHWFVNTAGTAAASSLVFRMVSGTTTTTLGTATPGTSAAEAAGPLFSMTAGVTPTLAPAGASLWVQNGATDALGNWSIVWEVSNDWATSAVTAATTQGG